MTSIYKSVRTANIWGRFALNPIYFNLVLYLKWHKCQNGTLTLLVGASPGEKGNIRQIPMRCRLSDIHAWDFSSLANTFAKVTTCADYLSGWWTDGLWTESSPQAVSLATLTMAESESAAGNIMVLGWMERFKSFCLSFCYIGRSYRLAYCRELERGQLYLALGALIAWRLMLLQPFVGFRLLLTSNIYSELFTRRPQGEEHPKW